MTKEQIKEQLVAAIRESVWIADDLEINMDSHFINDLNFDSIDFPEALIKAEEVFGVSISDEEAENINTVGDLVSLIESKL